MRVPRGFVVLGRSSTLVIVSTVFLLLRILRFTLTQAVEKWYTTYE